MKNGKKQELIDNQCCMQLYERYGIGKETENQSSLEYWGLPLGIVDGFYKHTKIRKLFEWQIDLLKCNNVINGESSLVYFAPTSGGKSLPAEIIMLRNIFAHNKRCVYVLPFVSIVNEKTNYLKRICETSNVKIEAFWGQTQNVWSQHVDIAVWTIEKANSILNKVIEQDWYQDLHIFVFDELHMILDQHRGYQIEYILSKLRALEKLESERINELDNQQPDQVQQNLSNEKKLFQIIGMSATMGNSDKLKEWLNWDIFNSDFRPVPLSEYYCFKNSMFDKESRKVLEFPSDKFGFTFRQIWLVIDTYFKKNKSVILFWNTKKSCEVLADKIANIAPESYITNNETMKKIPDEIAGYLYSKSKKF